MSKRLCAAFTIAQDEPQFLPIWTRYYSGQLGSDNVFILDHDSVDERTLAAARACNRVPVHRTVSFDHNWLRGVVQDFQRFLLDSYEYVVFAEADEIVAANPMVAERGLTELVELCAEQHLDVIQLQGYEVIQMDPGDDPLDWSRPLLRQRPFWTRSPTYSKRTLAQLPMRWEPGFHTGRPADARTYSLGQGEDVALIHLHRVDYAYCLERHRRSAARQWSTIDVQNGRGIQNRITEADAFNQWFYRPETVASAFRPLVPEPIPEYWLDTV